MTDQQLMDLWVRQRDRLRELFDRDGRLPWGMNCIVWHGAPGHMSPEGGEGEAVRAEAEKVLAHHRDDFADVCIVEQSTVGIGMVDMIFTYSIDSIAFWDDRLWEELCQRVQS